MSGSKFVTADAQFGNGIILRPFDNFQTVYNGVSALTPIMWSPGGQPLDDAAGQPGYSPHFLKGMAVPLGARVVLWLPVFGTVSSPINPYSWQLFWRVRNLFDFRQNRVPFHLPKQSPGVADTTPVTGGPRVLIPACYQSVMYAAAEQMSTNAPLAQPQDLHTEYIFNQPNRVMAGGGLVTPLIPGGTKGVIQQGVFDEVGPTVGNPSWTEFEVQALGDELLIGMTRTLDLNANPNWVMTTFGDYDSVLPFARMTISPDWGIYAFVGSAP